MPTKVNTLERGSTPSVCQDFQCSTRGRGHCQSYDSNCPGLLTNQSGVDAGIDCPSVDTDPQSPPHSGCRNIEHPWDQSSGDTPMEGLLQ